MNHYQTLGVNPRADISHIRRAFIAHSRRSHPDLGSAGEREARTAQMQKINAAYRVLRNPTMRAAYDLSLTEASQPTAPRDNSAATTEPAASANEPAAQSPAASADWQEMASDFVREAIATPIRRWVSLVALSLAATVAGGVGLGISVAVLVAIVMAVVRNGEVTPAHNVGYAAGYFLRQVRAGSEVGMLWLAVRNRSWPWLAAVACSLVTASLLYLVVSKLLLGSGGEIAAVIGFAASSLVLLPAANRAHRALL